MIFRLPPPWSTHIGCHYRVRSLPTLLIFTNGEVRDQFVGSNITKDQLRAKLEAVMT